LEEILVAVAENDQREAAPATSSESTQPPMPSEVAKGQQVPPALLSDTMVAPAVAARYAAAASEAIVLLETMPPLLAGKFAADHLCCWIPRRDEEVSGHAVVSCRLCRRSRTWSRSGCGPYVNHQLLSQRRRKRRLGHNVYEGYLTTNAARGRRR